MIIAVSDQGLDDVISAELDLLRPEVRANRTRVELLLDEDFVEIGASGRRWKRDAIIAELAGSPDVESNVSAMSVRAVAAHVALVEYETTTPDRRVLRSSWWRKCEGGWRCFFHQGTVARSSQ